MRWPRYWGFRFSINPSTEYSGLISFRIDWFDLLAVKGTLKSLLQHQNSKAPILRHSAFFSSVDKESACSAGDPGSIPGSGRYPGEGNGNWLQYPCQENPTVHGVTIGHDLVTKPATIAAFVMVQLSHPYKTTEKTIALAMWTFVSNVMSLLFNTLFKFIIAFFYKEQVSFNFMATVTIHSDAQEGKNLSLFPFPPAPIYLPWSDETKCHDLSFLNGDP